MHTQQGNVARHEISEPEQSDHVGEGSRALRPERRSEGSPRKGRREPRTSGGRDGHPGSRVAQRGGFAQTGKEGIPWKRRPGIENPQACRVWRGSR